MLSPAEARKLLKTTDTDALAGLRARPKVALFQTVDPVERRLTGRALDRRVVLPMTRSVGWRGPDGS